MSPRPGVDAPTPSTTPLRNRGPVTADVAGAAGPGTREPNASSPPWSRVFTGAGTMSRSSRREISRVDCDLVRTVPRSLWSTGYRGDLSAYLGITLGKAWAKSDEFDLIHSHLDTAGLPFARWCPTPVVSTLHGRVDGVGHPELLDEFCDVPLVAISDSQRRWSPRANWVATVHHGLDLTGAPFGSDAGQYLAFIGRIAPEKGVVDAVDLARATGLVLRVGAKVYDDRERDLFDRVVAPAVADGVVEIWGRSARESVTSSMQGPWRR